MTLCIIIVSGIFGCLGGSGKSVKKVGYHLQKIKDISYKLSVKKIDASQAAKRILSHMEDIKQLDSKISDTEPIKALLLPFIEKWHSEDNILASLTDGEHLFMSEVNAFFIRGYVAYKDEWKTLFPIFKP